MLFSGIVILAISSYFVPDPLHTVNARYNGKISQNWVDLTLKDAKLNNIEFEPDNKTISLSIGTDRIGGAAAPFVNITLPISLFGSAIDLKSYSETTGQEGGLVKQFKITQQFRTSHLDETTVFVELNPNNRGQISIIGSH